MSGNIQRGVIGLFGAIFGAGVPIAKVAKIAGWSTATMVRMAARYGHFTLNELRDAVVSATQGCAANADAEVVWRVVSLMRLGCEVC